MYWISVDFWKESLLILICIIIVAVVIEVAVSMIFGGSFFVFSGPISMGIKGLMIIVLGGLLATGVDEAYAAVHPHHLHISDKINYFDPYGGWHYWPDDNQFCTAEGGRITREESLQLYNDAHDFVYDAEGNVIATYPKGEAPETGWSTDSPYYVPNMSTEQAEAYHDAKYIIETKKYISKSKLYDILMDPADYRYNYTSEVVEFAFEALEENGIADWEEFCKRCASDTLGFRPDFSKEDLYNDLTEWEGYTPEEARIAVEYAFENE